MPRSQLPSRFLTAYFLVGVGVTAADVLIVWVGVAFVQLPILAATAAAYLLASIGKRWLNHTWVRDLEFADGQQAANFWQTTAIGLVVVVGLMWAMLQLPIWPDDPWGYLLAKLVVSLVIFTYGFLANQFWRLTSEFLLDLHPSLPTASSGKFLSVVIPAYNERNRLPETLKQVIAYLGHKSFDWEVIVVDDGSKDGMTPYLQRQFSGQEKLQLIRNEVNHGKGHAVKTGVLNASGAYILFLDADNSTPVTEFDRFEPLLSPDRILIGSRYKRGNNQQIKKQPWYRILISRLGNAVIRMFLLLDIQDTQCGFKVFPHDKAQALFGLQRIEKFGFDMEVLALAALSGMEIQEVPVNWFDAAGSRLRPFRDSLVTFRDLVRIKINILTKYYHWRTTRLDSLRQTRALRRQPNLPTQAETSIQADSPGN